MAALFVPTQKDIREMGLFTKDIKTMDDLFVHQLQDIYYAEKQLVKALPKMAEKATDRATQGRASRLASWRQTKVHVERLEQVFKMHGTEIKAVTCPAIDGIIKEADETASEVEDKKVLDAALDQRRASRGALRDRALRQLDRMGQATWPQRLRERFAEDSRRGKSHRSKADVAGRRQDQSARRELIAVA